jgi:WD40 repeat protein
MIQFNSPPRRRGETLVVASDDGSIRGYSTGTGEMLAELSAHEDAVQAVVFDSTNQYLISCGSDNTFRLWQN